MQTIGFRIVTKKVILISRKLWDIVTYQVPKNPIHFGKFTFKVKVTAAEKQRKFFGENWFMDANSKSCILFSMKLLDIVTYQIPKNPIDFRKFLLKIKVTGPGRVYLW